MRAATPRKWQLIENVVAACERIKHTDIVAHVTQKAMLPVLTNPSRRREVDVLIRIPVGDRVLSIGVEVRARRTRLDVPHLAALVDLKTEIGLDRLCVLSTAGFTSSAREKGLQSGVQLVTPRTLDDSGVFPAESEAFVETVGVDIDSADVLWPTDPFPALAGAHLDAIFLVTHAGETIPLRRVIHGASARAVMTNKPLAAHGEPVEIRLDEPARSFAAIRVGDNEGPVPLGFRVRGRCVRTAVSHFVIRIFGMELATFVPPAEGELRQWTLAMQSAGTAGAKLSLTTGPALPKRRRVGPLPGAEGAG